MDILGCVYRISYSYIEDLKAIVGYLDALLVRLKKLSSVFGESGPELETIKERWTDPNFVYSTFPFLLDLTFEQPPKDKMGNPTLVGLPEYLDKLFRDTELIAMHWSEIYLKILGCREILAETAGSAVPDDSEWGIWRQGMHSSAADSDATSFVCPNEESSRRPAMSAELPEWLTLEKVLNLEGHDDLPIYKEYVRELEETRRREIEAARARKRRREENPVEEMENGRDFKYNVSFVDPERGDSVVSVVSPPSSSEVDVRSFWFSSRRRTLSGGETGDRRLSLNFLDVFRRYSRSTSKGKEPCKDYEEQIDRTHARPSFLSQASRRIRPNLEIGRDALEGSAIE